MKLLALDLGRTTGVAFGNIRGAPTCHTETLGEPGSSQSARFCQALRMTARLIDDLRPDAVIIEKPIAAGPVGKEVRVQQAFGYRSNVFGVAHMKSVQTGEYTVGDIRQYLIGQSHMKSELAKPRVFEACQAFGWNVEGYDQSDAAACWHFGRAKLFGVTVVSGLFGDEING